MIIRFLENSRSEKTVLAGAVVFQISVITPSTISVAAYYFFKHSYHNSKGSKSTKDAAYRTILAQVLLAVSANKALINALSYAMQSSAQRTVSLSNLRDLLRVTIEHVSGLLIEVLPEVSAMKGVEQPPQYHPEGDVWTHTLLLLDGLERGCSKPLAWGVLLHDIGKPPTFRVAPDRIRFDARETLVLKPRNASSNLWLNYRWHI